MAISTFWNEKLAPEQALYYKQSFSVLRTTLNTCLKCWLTAKFLQNFICLQSFLQKGNVSQTQGNWFVFLESVAYKRQWCTDLHNPIWIGLNESDYSYTVMLWEFFPLYLSLVKVIPETQSMSEQLLLEYGYFCQTSSCSG